MEIYRNLTFKHQNTLGIFDYKGAIHKTFVDELGIYYKGTRYISHFELFLFGEEPFFLGVFFT